MSKLVIAEQILGSHTCNQNIVGQNVDFIYSQNWSSFSISKRIVYYYQMGFSKYSL
jgi:hypothetical protein